MTEDNKNTPAEKPAIDEQTAKDIANMGNETADKGKRKWVWGGGLAAAALVAFFAVSGGDDEEKVVQAPPAVETITPAPMPHVVAPAPEAVRPPVATPRVDTPREVVTSLTPAERSALQASSVQAKTSSIYWNPDAVMRDDRGSAVEAFITADGQQARSGEDFATHVSLIEGGGVSILVADGPYAGSRVYVSPAEDMMQFSRVGEVSMAKDGRTPFYQLTSRFNGAAKDTYLSQLPTSGMAVDVHGVQVQKKVGGDTAFTVIGEPEVDGRVKVQLWNDDTVTVDFGNGTVVVDSLFMADPDYLAKYDRTGATTEPVKAYARIGTTPATPGLR